MRNGPKICVFLPNWVGDTAMATPALRAIRKHFGPDAALVGIMKPYVGAVLEGVDWFDQRWWFDPTSSDWRQRPLGVTWKILRGRFDWAVLLPNTRPIAVMAWLGRAKRRVGYARYRRGFFLTDPLTAPSANGAFLPVSTLDYYLAVSRAMGCADESARIELATTAEDEQAADRVWRTLGLNSDGRVVVLNSSGAFGAVKLWPVESCAVLARRIVRELDHQVLVLCGPDERENAARIVEQSAQPGVTSLAGQRLSIGLSKACVRRSRLMISTDSGPRHFAAAFGLPLVTLYGPTHPAWSDLHEPRETKLSVPVDCGPCQQSICRTGDNRCMRGIDVDMVLRAVSEHLRG